MRAAALIVALAWIAPAQAPGQTVADAAWANMGIAIQLCESRERHRSTSTLPAWPQHFRNAGFTERVERSRDSIDSTHWFTAPADTVNVELYYGHMPDHCTVTTRHQGVTLTSQLLDALIPQMFPGYVRHVAEGAPDPTTGRTAICVRYEDPTNDIGHVVGVTSEAGEGCVEDGTSLVFSSYRV